MGDPNDPKYFTNWDDPVSYPNHPKMHECAPQKRDLFLKRKGSSSKHYFSGDMSVFRVSSDKNKTTQHGPCVEDADTSKCERLALSQQLKPCFKLSHVRFLGAMEKIEAERWHRFHPQFCEMKDQIGFRFPDKNQLSCPKKTCIGAYTPSTPLAFQPKPPAKPRM